MRLKREAEAPWVIPRRHVPGSFRTPTFTRFDDLGVLNDSVLAPSAGMAAYGCIHVGGSSVMKCGGRTHGGPARACPLRTVLSLMRVPQVSGNYVGQRRRNDLFEELKCQ